MPLANPVGYELSSAEASAVVKIIEAINAGLGLSLPAGGVAGQILQKFSSTPADAGWVNAPAAGGGVLLEVNGGSASSSYPDPNVDAGNAGTIYP